MLFAWSRRVALGVMLLSGCKANDSADRGLGPQQADGGADAGASVAFDASGTMTALPSQTLSLGLTVTSSGDAASDAVVTVWLDGDYLDASLSADTVTTQGGHGAVTLHTPSVTSTFTVGAKVDGGTAVYLEVSVSSSGFGVVRVLPTYPGRRTALDFRASVFAHTTCLALKNQPIKDGGLAADGKFAEPIVIANVPAGAPLAIFVHVAHLAMGCADVEALVPAKSTDVPVSVFDVPMALDRTDLDMTLTFNPEAADREAWSSMLDASITKSGAAFFASTAGATLVDGMRPSLGAAADQAQFDQERTQGSWDSKADAWLTAHAPSMHDRAAAWMTTVKSDAIGDLGLHLGPGATTGTAAGSAVSFGALSAATAGMTITPSLVWTADAADTVHLAGTLMLAPTALVAHLADLHAAHDVAQSTGVATAIASVVDCAGLAASLVGSGALYGQCTASCAADACRAAIAAEWTRATDPIAVPAASITVTASGSAKVGDDAEPLTVDGAWVGQVSASTGSSAMKGALTAKKPGTN